MLYKSTRKAMVVSNRQRCSLRCLRSTRLRQSRLAISLVDFHPLPLPPLSSLLTTLNIGDNHGSNDKLCRLLQKRFPTWIAVYHQIRCIIHIINLIVQAFLFTKNQEAVELAVQATEELQAAEQKLTIESENEYH